MKPRARDLGLPFPGTPGPFNAITDVPGVRVGFTTLTDPARKMRTGVTAILPRPDSGSPRPVWAGFAALNGNGEMTGTHWVNDAGYFLGPVLITNTHGIGACHHGATEWMIRTYDSHFRDEHAWAMPIVAETYDGTLNDINALHVKPEHAIAALDAAATGPVAEGSVGGGNGMIAYDFKGGTGTASRRVEIGGATYTVAALVQANYGRRPWFTVLGVPVGREMPEGTIRDQETGSIIVILATDAPLSDAILRGLARRAGLGIARSGSPGGNSSGDIFLAFSVADDMPAPPHAGPVITRHSLNWDELDPLYQAAVEAVDESVINAIVQGEDVACVKPEGKTCHGIDTARLMQVMAKYGRL
ncbi:MAG TPA: P1 family peptidase [Albidovulum sp.]|uniref:DmpA family aminopeptidase n=1 Tax=Albidovulum sp. TaxID=1872424 RepID=UPI002CD48CC2|nr:P1 family peptidase [Defluviimonas sp.]MCP5355700.1 P1 family peptidase [Paracoccaceae bacterium]MCP5376454.1 P1 family peptidase [Paracoccaceae bacterium]HRV61518.1 P1 family peptidase [Albidovulum sp.]